MVRTSKDTIELLVSPDDTSIKATKYAVEVLFPEPVKAFTKVEGAAVSQCGIEVLAVPDAGVRVDQYLIEVLMKPSDSVQITLPSGCLPGFIAKIFGPKLSTA